MSENTNNKPKINMPRFNLSWLYVIIAMSFAILYFSNQEGGIDKQITYTEFKDMINKGYANKIIKETFGSLALGNYLKNKQYNEITLVGVVSNICVISNAIIIKAALPEASIIIDCLGIASNDPLLEQKSIDIMENLHMKIINKKR